MITGSLLIVAGISIGNGWLIAAGVSAIVCSVVKKICCVIAVISD